MKQLLTLLCAFLLPVLAFSQSDQDTTKTNRTFSEATYFGGGVGLSFGSVTDIQLSPQLGYYIDQGNRISVGGGIQYRYFADNRGFADFQTSFYGYNVFSRTNPFDNFFTHVEYQRLSVPRLIGGIIDGSNVDRIWVPALLAGGGYALEVGSNVYLLTQITYELLNNPNNFFPNNRPIVQVSISTGF